MKHQTIVLAVLWAICTLQPRISLAWITDGDVANAEASAAQAKGVANAAKSRLTVVTNGIRATFEATPDYLTASKALKDDTDSYEAKKEAALDQLHASQFYLNAVADHDHKHQLLEDARKNGDTPDDIVSYAQDDVKAGQVITQMEAKTLRDDPDVQAAKKALADARDAANALEDKFKISLAANPDWQKAKADYDKADGTYSGAL